MAATSSMTTRWFSLRVDPVSTRSTMRSASPTSGASSTEPWTKMTSAWIPRAAKWSVAMRGDFVATRGTLGISVRSAGAPTATRAQRTPPARGWGRGVVVVEHRCMEATVGEQGGEHLLHPTFGDGDGERTLTHGGALLALSLHAHHVGAEAGEFHFDVLVAAVEVVDPPDLRFAFARDETGDDERRARAKIGRHDARAGERLHAAHDRGVAAHRHVGPHAHDLGHVHEPILEDPLRD